jgi:general secretion pathway protein G
MKRPYPKGCRWTSGLHWSFRNSLTSMFLATAKLPPRRASSGFTLLELLVVIVIIGLLAGYVGPKYFAQVGKSEVKVARAQIDAFEKALDNYRLDVGRYPSTEQGLAALEVRPDSEARWQGPYLKKAIPLDPWGKPYQYRAPGEKGEFDLYSWGKDGQAGGEGDNADIGNWN